MGVKVNDGTADPDVRRTWKKRKEIKFTTRTLTKIQTREKFTMGLNLNQFIQKPILQSDWTENPTGSNTLQVMVSIATAYPSRKLPGACFARSWRINKHIIYKR